MKESINQNFFISLAFSPGLDDQVATVAYALAVVENSFINIAVHYLSGLVRKEILNLIFELKNIFR